MRRLLNVGGGSKATPLPPPYARFEHVLLDIDPAGSPDIVCDARRLTRLDAGQFDAVYCSHNLEHYYPHDVPDVLAGFLHVLRDDGFAHIRVPDLHEVMRTTIERGLDVEDALYESMAGPIRVLDVLYGFAAQIEQSGQDYYAHKTGFTRASLVAALRKAGFGQVHAFSGHFEVIALAFKSEPGDLARSLFKLPEAQESSQG